MMTFDDLIMSRPKVRIADIIQLFLLGYDDKIYLDIFKNDEEILHEVRIIHEDLIPYYEEEIKWLEDSYYNSRSKFEVHI